MHLLGEGDILLASILIRDAHPACQRGCVVIGEVISSISTPLQLLSRPGIDRAASGNPRLELTRYVPDRSPDLS